MVGMFEDQVVQSGEVQGVALLLGRSSQQRPSQLGVGGDHGRELLIERRVALSLVLGKPAELVCDPPQILVLSFHQWFRH